MPGGGASGALACWTVNFDLANSGQAFTMLADGDGVWSNGTSDRFGWSCQQPGAAPFGNSGPLIGGDPRGYLNGGPGSNGCDLGANTVFYAGSLPNSQGTGLSTDDAWEEDVVSPTPAYVNCWYWGGYYSLKLYASWYMVLAAETGAGPIEPGFAYCPGDGIAPHTLCPCGNSNNGAMGGCDWGSASFPEGGVLTATGDDVYANADVMLVANGIQNNFGIFFAANIQVNSGNGNALNDGLRCAGGGLIRLTAPTPATGNTASHGPIEASDVSAAPGVTRRYQYWFRTPGGPCGTSANLTNGYEIAWL
jgi:hypothetical protein